jgi:hypothetical protein
MQEQCVNNVDLRLDERESALLARAVEWLVQELGFPPDDVNRSYQDSFAFFINNPEQKRHFLTSGEHGEKPV